MKFEELIPILYTSDFLRSIAYYTDVLGFEETWAWDDPPTFGGVSSGNVRLFLSEGGHGNPGTWICINVENVDEYYEVIKAKGAQILSPPEDKPWFMREMLVQDPDGHNLRFGQEIECE